MQITITARHFNLTDALRDHIEKETSKIEKYFDHIIDSHFILTLEDNRNNVEMIVNIPKKTFKSQVVDQDMYVAIDKVIDKMERQVKKLKEKWSDHQKKGLGELKPDFVYADLIERKESRRRLKIKRIFADSMTIDDALDLFEKQEEAYFVFTNLETDRVNVLIKRDEEHYKLIQP